MTKSAQLQRLAFVSDAVYPFNKGGKEMRLHEISTRLAKTGYDVHVYTMQWWEGGRTLEQNGVHYHAISKLYPLYQGSRRSMREAIMFGLATFKLFGAKFDVIDVDSMPFFPLFSARLVCWLRGKRLHATWHEVTDLAVWHAYVGRVSGTIAWVIERLAMLMPNVIVASSEHTTRRLKEAGSRKAIVTIPLGMPLQAITKTAPSAVKSDIIYVGRLLPHKNVHQLIEAVALLKAKQPDITCHIIGDGPERPRLVQLIADLGLEANVKLLGIIERHQDVYAHLKASRVFVSASVREGFGLVIVEANAAGLPVVTTTHPDNASRDLITEGVNGYLCEANPAALAATIQRTLDPKARLNPTAGLEQYDWNSVVKRIEQTLTT